MATFQPKSLKNSHNQQQTPENCDLQLPVVDYIKRRWNVGFNVFTREAVIIEKETKLPMQFVDFYLQIKHVGGFKTSKNDILDLLESNLFPVIHPVRNFFDSLQTKYRHISHINLLCEYIKAKDFGDGIDYQERFASYFKRCS